VSKLGVKSRMAILMSVLALASCGVSKHLSLQKGQQVLGKDLIFAFNKGNDTVSVIDPTTDTVKVVQNVPLDAYGLYPSNQYGLGSGYLLVPTTTQVVVLRDSDLKPVSTIALPAAKGIWNQILPDGKEGVIVGRSNDVIDWVDMNPSSREFGVVVKSVTVPGDVGLCDVSLDPTGTYAYIPDLYKSEIQVVSVSTGATVYQAPVPGIKEEFMGTVSWNGKWWAVENKAGNGSVSYFSLADPTKPKLVATLDTTDGMGLGPHTNDFSPDSKLDFVLDRTSSQVSVVDMSTLKVVKNIDLPKGGKPRVGAFSYHGHLLFVSLEGVNSVAVINTSTLTLEKVLKVGPDPVGIAPTDYAWVPNG